VPGWKLLRTQPADIAAAGYAALMQGQRVVIPGVANKLVTFLPRVLPRGFLLRQVARSQFERHKSPPSL